MRRGMSDETECKYCLSREWEYVEMYDAHYCKDCKHWLESRCHDRDCEYCLTRPDTYEPSGEPVT